MFILGLDYHGVLDKFPDLFGPLSRIILASGGRVYIITGHRLTQEFSDKLKNLGIEYTEILSIIDYHAGIGVKIRYDEKGDPWIDEETWNTAKAVLCERYNVTLHIDDSEIYGKYFTGKTKYLKL